MIRIAITDMPPSANAMRAHFIAGGVVKSVKSKAYAAWKDAASWEIKGQRQGVIIGPYSLSIVAQRNWRSKRARDIDNIIKPVSDALVAAGVVVDDSLAERVSIAWSDDLHGPAVIAIIQEAEDGALAA